MAEEHGGPDGTAEGSEVGNYVVNRRNESSVEDVRDRNHEAARKGDRQQETHHEERVSLIVRGGGCTASDEIWNHVSVLWRPMRQRPTGHLDRALARRRPWVKYTISRDDCAVFSGQEAIGASGVVDRRPSPCPRPRHDLGDARDAAG